MELNQLLSFITEASKATYASDGKREEKPERKSFTELVYEKGKFHYRDSWTGFIRSRGMELVRYDGLPVWSSLYGGGMIGGHEEKAEECFAVLKEALRSDDKPISHVRGPKKLHKGIWSYTYQQLGDKTEFDGHEEIYHANKLVFFHRVIGGLIKHRQTK